MNTSSIRHGCLAAAVLLAVTLPARAQTAPLCVQSRVFEIEYNVQRGALPLVSVQLWYTLDEGRSWHFYGTDDDRQSPISFNAAVEGLHGFFFVVTNGSGPSSGPPATDTVAHVRAMVDYTPPIAQLHPPRQTVALGKPVVQIRWTAIDAHLNSRPIEIEWRRPPQSDWHPVLEHALANTGRFDWRIPDGVTGPIAFRLTVADRGGHQVRAQSEVIELAPFEPPSTNTSAALKTTGLAAPAGTDPAKDRAAQLFDEALALRDRGLKRRALSRLREVSRLDPTRADALSVMGSLLYGMGELDRAGSAFELALGVEPTRHDALHGAARVDVRQNKYDKATQRLMTILRSDPADARAWLNLGDLAIYQGDDVTARERYLRAASIDPSASEVIKRAQSMLQELDKASRVYRVGRTGDNAGQP